MKIRTISGKLRIGMVVGRFQPVHNGHLSIIYEALDNCDYLIIAIGSAQESNTPKNPFSFEFRKKLIVDALGEKANDVEIIGINDRETISDDCGWGEYLLSEIERQTGKKPTISFEGVETVRSNWFDTCEIRRYIVPRTLIPISASEIRKNILTENYLNIIKYSPNSSLKYIEEMKQILKEVNKNEIN